MGRSWRAHAKTKGSGLVAILCLDYNMPDYNCKRLSTEFTCPSRCSDNLKFAGHVALRSISLLNYKEETITRNLQLYNPGPKLKLLPRAIWVSIYRISLSKGGNSGSCRVKPWVYYYMSQPKLDSFN